MNILSVISYIANHPLNKKQKVKAITRFVKWQIYSRTNSQPLIHQFTEHSKLIIRRGMTGATGNLYCGLHEFNDMGFLLHFLRKGDMFVDIGANIGSYTILSAGELGVETLAIEPVPSTYADLQKNIALNNLDPIVTSKNIALGSKKGKIAFTTALDTVNHVATEDDDNTIDVNVETLDDILNEQLRPSLIKIDVEGFETEVLSGAKKSLASDTLKAIIIELNGSGSRYGYDEEKIHNLLIDNGFTPHSYDPFTRNLIPSATYGSFNTIYIRDLPFVNDRISSARQIKVLNHSF